MVNNHKQIWLFDRKYVHPQCMQNKFLEVHIFYQFRNQYLEVRSRETKNINLLGHVI